MNLLDWLRKPGTRRTRQVVANRLNAMSELAAKRDGASLASIDDFLRTTINELRQEPYGSEASLKRRIPAWGIFQSPEGPARFLRAAVAKMERERLPNFSVVVTPHSGLSRDFKDVLVREGVEEKDTACIMPDMPNGTIDELRTQVRAGMVRFLITDPYRLDSTWHLGSMSEAARQLVVQTGNTNPTQKVQATLFFVDPELMTTLQLNRAFAFLDRAHDTNFSRACFIKDIIGVVCTVNALDSKILREKKGLNTPWNIKYVRKHAQLAVHENDCRELSKTLALMHHHVQQSGKWTLIDDAMMLLKAIYESQARP